MIAFELVDWRSTDELIERALVARPELADAKARVRARRADERAAENAWLLPELELGATLGEYGLNYGNHEDRQVYSAALRWDLGAGLIGERDRDRALRRAAEFQQARMEDAVVSQVVQSAALVEARFDELAAASSEVTAAEVAFQLVRARHEAGASLLLEVLEVEVGLVRARAGHVDALAGYNRAQYALLHAVGEGSPQGQ
jgi:outer membrane protein TolC